MQLITNPDMLHLSVSLSSEGGQAIFTQSFLYRSGQKRGTNQHSPTPTPLLLDLISILFEARILRIYNEAFE